MSHQKTIEERLQRLEDESLIRDLAARFADAETRGDQGTVRSLFKPDTLFQIGEPNAVTCQGVDAIITFLNQLRGGKEFFVQFVHGGIIDVQGDTASARWLMREVALASGSVYYNNFGFFLDELERVDGQWLFKSRNHQYLYLDTDPFTGRAIPFDMPINCTRGHLPVDDDTNIPPTKT